MKSLETTVARLRSERASDADDIAAMLVRVSETDRERADAHQRAERLERQVKELEGASRSRATTQLPRPNVELERSRARVSELEQEVAEERRQVQKSRDDLAHAERALDAMTTRAEAAEGKNVDAAEELDALELRATETERVRRDLAEDLERARADLAAERAKVSAVLADLAQTRGDEATRRSALETKHLEQLATVRAEHTVAIRHAARSLHDERAAAEAAARRAEMASQALTEARGLLGELAKALDEIERQESMDAAARAIRVARAREIASSFCPGGDSTADPSLTIVSSDKPEVS